jgi:hypothetical protein
MQKTNASKSLLVASAMALLVGAVDFLIGVKESSQVQPDKRVTTETAAAAAGAQVTPTEPKLRGPAEVKQRH